MSGRENGDALAGRLLAFALMAALGTALWFTLVAGSGAWRAALVVLTAVGGALALGAIGRSRLPFAAAQGLALLTAIATLAVALLAAGLPAHYLAPGHWDELFSHLDPALGRIDEIDVPFDSEGPWVRRAILMIGAALLAISAALAFWPLRPDGDRRARAARILRGAGFTGLLVLCGIALTWDRREGEMLIGLALLLGIGAWLWLPQAGARRLLPGVAAVLASAVVVFPAASAIGDGDPWWDYQSWDLFGKREQVSFQWNHTYGPIDWPRDGTTLFEVRSEEPHYWKTEVLDEFDGQRWRRADDESPALSPFALSGQESTDEHPEWEREVSFRILGLRSFLLVGAGTIEDLDGFDALTPATDGSTPTGIEPIAAGDEYSVSAYVPDPTARQMKLAPSTYDAEVHPYTTVEVPVRVSSFYGGEQGAYLRYTVTLPAWGSGVSSPSAESLLAGSPYARAHRLAQRLTAGSPDVYTAVKSIEAHLQRGFTYSELPPEHTFGLAAFLFEDRAGYCQQFSGAMALLLRLSGIPARVAAGFAPGTRVGPGRYEVTDFDAHSWVEVYFNGIGWVAFDPTPSASPVASQFTGTASAGLTPDGTGPAREQDLSGLRPGADAPAEEGGGGMPPLLIGLGAAGLLAAAVGGLLALRRRRALLAGRASEAQLAEVGSALSRLGWPYRHGATLLALEQRLGRNAPAAAGYLAGLRAWRYGEPSAPRPGPGARRAFRSALSGAGGISGRLRGYRAIPPGGPRLRA